MEVVVIKALEEKLESVNENYLNALLTIDEECQIISYFKTLNTVNPTIQGMFIRRAMAKVLSSSL
jgi:hypothetical protein